MTSKRKAERIGHFEFSFADYKDKSRSRWFDAFETPYVASFLLVGLYPPKDEARYDDGSQEFRENNLKKLGRYLDRHGYKVYELIVRAIRDKRIITQSRRNIMDWAHQDDHVRKYLPIRILKLLDNWKNERLNKEHTSFRLQLERVCEEISIDQVWDSIYKKEFIRIIQNDAKAIELKNHKVNEIIMPFLEKAFAEIQKIGLKEPPLPRTILELQCKNKLQVDFEDEYEYCVENNLELSFKEFMQRASIQGAIARYKANKLKAPEYKTIEEWFPYLKFPVGKE